MRLNETRTQQQYRIAVILDHVQKYVDERAHVARVEDDERGRRQYAIRYSIKLQPGPRRPRRERRVLGNTDINRIFEELYNASN